MLARLACCCCCCCCVLLLRVGRLVEVVGMVGGVVEVCGWRGLVLVGLLRVLMLLLVLVLVLEGRL